MWEDATTKFGFDHRRTYLLGKGLDSVMNYPFKNAVLVEVAHADDSGRFIVGSDVFGREKVESRPVQGQARFRLDRGFPGGGGESSLGNGQEQAKQEQEAKAEEAAATEEDAGQKGVSKSNG